MQALMHRRTTVYAQLHRCLCTGAQAYLHVLAGRVDGVAIVPFIVRARPVAGRNDGLLSCRLPVAQVMVRIARREHAGRLAWRCKSFG